eukprot:3931997-Rhodomonas_salina.2
MNGRTASVHSSMVSINEATASLNGGTAGVNGGRPAPKPKPWRSSPARFSKVDGSMLSRCS